MVMSGKEIENAFERIAYACYEIKERDMCDNCPMKHLCLEDTGESVITFADLISSGTWDEFLEFSDHAYVSEETRKAEYADMMRKIDLEERMIDEYDG